MTHENPQQSTHDSNITGSTVIALITIVFTGAWIAFAYYKGTNTGDILLLHPLVAILLIFLLFRTRFLLSIKSIVDVQMMMIGFWLFSRLSGVLMPFLLGFGLAYFFRFLMGALQDIRLPRGRRLQMSRGYARGVLIVIVIGMFATLFGYIIPQIRDQSQQMTKGLVKFYQQSVVPFVVGGNKLNAIAIDPNNPEVVYLGRTNGVHRIERDPEAGAKVTNLTDEAFAGDSIRTIAATSGGRYQIYLATSRGLYGREVGSKSSKLAPTWYRLGKETFLFSLASTSQGEFSDNTMISENLIQIFQERGISLFQYSTIATKAPGRAWLIADSDNQQEYHVRKERDALKVYGRPFAGKPIRSIAAPVWSPSQIYVGTDSGLFRSDDNGATWRPIRLNLPAESGSSQIDSPIVSLACSSRRSRAVYIATEAGVYRLTYSDQNETVTTIEDLRPPTEVTVQSLAVATFEGTERLYVGTSQGIYQWLTPDGWRLLSDANARLPLSAVSLLAIQSEGVLYAGNSESLYYSARLNSDWEPLIEVGQGILVELNRLPFLDTQDFVHRAQEYLNTKLPTLAKTGSEFVGTLIRGGSKVAVGFGGVLATGFLALMVFIYASRSFRSYVRSFVNLFPEGNRDTVRLYLREIDQNLQSFLRGQATVILIISFISIIVYGLIGVPFALIVGLLAGLCNAIPTFGPFIGGAFAILSLLMGFAAGNFNLIGFLIRIGALFVAIFGIQAVDNSLISPKVMSSAVDVDPLLIMFGVIVGASVLGFWGVLLAIPIIVVTKSMFTVSSSIQAGDET